jgi:hypothetical protein
MTPSGRRRVPLAACNIRGSYRHGGPCSSLTRADLFSALLPAASAGVIDSRTLKSTPERGHRVGYDGTEGKTGSKVRIAVDALSPLLALRARCAEERAAYRASPLKPHIVSSFLESGLKNVYRAPRVAYRAIREC